MSLFYVPNIVSGNNILPEEESLHAVKVLRLQAGDEIVVVDGTGGYYRAKLHRLTLNVVDLKSLIHSRIR